MKENSQNENNSQKSNKKFKNFNNHQELCKILCSTKNKFFSSICKYFLSICFILLSHVLYTITDFLEANSAPLEDKCVRKTPNKSTESLN